MNTHRNATVINPHTQQYALSDVPEAAFAKPAPVRFMTDTPAIAWQHAAERLTKWTEERLLVHLEVVGGYYWVPEKRLIRHFDRNWDDALWFHPVSRSNNAKWFLIAVNHQCDDPTQRAIINWRAAASWHAELQCLGFRPLLLDSNDSTDLQILVCLSKSVPASEVAAFLQQFVSDYEARGLSQAPDFMPNQADIDSSLNGTKRWRLLGMDDTHRHFTRVWDGVRWLEREPAIEVILATTGDPPELIPGYQENLASKNPT